MLHKVEMAEDNTIDKELSEDTSPRRRKPADDFKSVSLDALIDISIIKQLSINVNGNSKNHGDADASSDEESPVLSSSLLDEFNEDHNYSLLQKEYRRLMRKEDTSDSGSLGKILNVSLMQQSLEEPNSERR